MKKVFILISFISICFVSCKEMNENVDLYLSQGEIIYLAKSDSVKTFAGNERFLMRFWMSDPRASALHIYWSQKTDSLIIPLAESDLQNAVDVYVGKNGKTVTEGNYTLQLVTHDVLGNTSIVDERTVNVYGETFAKSLTQKFIKNAIYGSNDKLVLTFGGVASTKEVGIELAYTDKSGVIKHLSYSTDKIKKTLKDSVVLSNVDVLQPLTCRTKYLPESTAIDTFYTEYSVINVYERMNVALGKAATTSDITANYPGSMAVDGDISSTPSRWVSDDSNKEHWLEINLGAEYAISAFQTWSGDPAQKSFKLQAYISDKWVDVASVTDNAKYIYFADFPETKTSKVRYYIPAYTTNRVRLYEIAVYIKKKVE